MKLLVILLIVIFYCAFESTGKSFINKSNRKTRNSIDRFVYIPDNNGKIEIIDSEEVLNVNVKIELSDVHYQFFSNQNQDNNVHEIFNNNVNELDKTNFDPTKKILFLIHGWQSSKESDFCSKIKNAAIENHEINVFIVDWSNIASNLYLIAQTSIEEISIIVGEFINLIQDKYQINGEQFRLVGHSLGAHIAGNAAAISNSKINQIIGLDPASPLFNLNDIDRRLDTSDADYVQIIHTSCTVLGIASPIGHSDFYPNGGYVQAGCDDIFGACSHNIVNEFFAESLRRGEVFLGTKCTSYDDYLSGICNNNEVSPMGLLDVDKTASGVYYLTTNPEEPYGQA